MTRKEEVLQAAVRQFPRFAERRVGFMAGAEWADAHPDKKTTYTKQGLLDMGFAFDLNGNIVTPQEDKEATKKYLLYHKSQWVDEACNWLQAELAFYHKYHNVSDIDMDSLIKDFRKAMEE